MSNVFFDIGIIIIVASILAYITKLIKQPLVPAYIIAGILIGPLFTLIGTNVAYLAFLKNIAIVNSDTIILLSEIGIAFLLFIVGLEIDIDKLKSVALVSTVTGLGKSTILFGLGYLVAVLFNYIPRHAMYIGLILVFSSTMVVIKLLTDRREVDTLHGRVIVGILLVEDILAVLILSTLTTIDNFSFFVLAIALLKGIGLLVLALILSKYILPTVFKFAAESQELLFLISLTMCFLFGLLFSWIGFSIAIGAFVAGVALGNLPYNLEIISRVKPLRDFFATIFFVSLGLSIVFDGIKNILILAAILSLIIIIIKPILIMIFTSLFGYKERPAFLISGSLIQVSEFSMIVLMLGLKLEHITKPIFSLAIWTAIFTITITTYVIKYEQKLFDFFKKSLTFFEKFNFNDKDLKQLPKKKEKYDVIICGHNRLAHGILDSLKKIKRSVLVIDYDPAIIRHLIKQNIDAIYGDIGDAEIIDHLNLKKVKMIVSTVPDSKDSLLLLQKTKHVNKKAMVILTANQIDEALELYEKGADYVILPYVLGGTHHHVSALIRNMNGDLKTLIKKRLNHIKELHKKRIKKE